MTCRSVAALVAAFLVVALQVLAPAAFGQQAGTPRAFELDSEKLVVQTAVGPVNFDLEIADTPDERADGLMFRTDFPPDRALIFVFERERPVTFWMKNTPKPLDMLFVDTGGTIVTIRENSVPFSPDMIGSDAPVRFVVEVNAGIVAQYRIAVGDRIDHRVVREVAQ